VVQRHDLPLVGITGTGGSPGIPPRTAAAAVGSGGYDMTERGADRAADRVTDRAPDRVTDRVADRLTEAPVATASEPAAGPAIEPAAGPAAEPATAGDVLSEYLHTQAGDFLRSLRLHGESGADVEEAAEAARQLRRAARRISGALSVYRPITDTAWSDQLRAELAWLSGTLALEHAYAGRLARLRDALHRLSGAGGPPDRTPRGDAAAGEPAATGVDPEAVGASGSTTAAARTARGGVTAGIDGPSGMGPRSSRTARRSVSLAAGAPDPAPRATRGGPDEAAGEAGRPVPGGDAEASRRPYGQWDGTAEGTAANGAAGRAAGTADGADAVWPVPAAAAGGDGTGGTDGPGTDEAGAGGAGAAGVRAVRVRRAGARAGVPVPRRDVREARRAGSPAGLRPVPGPGPGVLGPVAPGRSARRRTSGPGIRRRPGAGR
jgi:hypothetical protein